jgi:hypothetical protein
MTTDDPHLRVLARAGISLLILVFGILLVMIPWAGTLFVVLLGWLPLIAWSIVNLKGFKVAAKERDFMLYVFSGFSVLVPVVVYGFHLWVLNLGP